MENAFVIENLSFTYPHQKKPALTDLSFTVQKGSIFGLLGPSGAGKSTTQKLLTKQLSDYTGTISVFGKTLSVFGQSYYEKIGVCFESPVHFNKLSGRENLEFFAKLYAHHVAIMPLLERVGLAEAADKPVGEYSKGMKVRLNFVRALINDPDILFLDEPTNGLDPNNAYIVKTMIKELRDAGKTVIITTHLMSDVEQLCDQVAFIVEGKMFEVSSPQALKLRYGTRTVTVTWDEKTQTFPLENLGQNDQFLTIIKQNHIATIHSGEPSMEDIFREVTGRADE